jgi:hypothetical protein
MSSPRPGWFTRLMDRLCPQVGGEIQIYIAPNERGGFSIYPANYVAAVLFGTDRDPWQPSELAAGNFGTYADAYRRAAHCNCWTVVAAPAAGESRTFETSKRQPSDTATFA